MRTSFFSLIAFGACLTFFTPAHGQSIQNICESPPAAVQTWTATFPRDESGTEDCAALCTKWVSTCKAVAGIAATCIRGGAAQEVALEKAQCKTLPTPEEEQICVQQWTSILKGYKALQQEILNQAKGDCEREESNCVDACAAPPV
jgi:hypothetical protein